MIIALLPGGSYYFALLFNKFRIAGRQSERERGEGKDWHVCRTALAGFLSRDTTLKVIKKFLKKVYSRLE